MKRYLTVLRGINVSGQKIIKMNALRSAMEGCGFQNVKTYIQSGNILFDSPETSKAILENVIHEAIFAGFGFKVPVIVLEKETLTTIATHNPFYTADKDLRHLHVTLLQSEAPEAAIFLLNPEAYLPDTFHISGKVIYLYTPGGYGSTKLSNTFFENKLKITATTRNWKTIQELYTLITN